MHSRFPFCLSLVLAVIGVIPTSVSGQERALTAERLQELLRRFPEADANRDGTLTETEARAYAAQRRGKQPASSSSVATAATVVPEPTVTDASYGPHPRNVLDFWRAQSEAATPVIIYIHGGGFVSGDKSGVRRDKFIQECLNAGVSFAAINYRFLSSDVPLQDILRDGARAVQFIRSKAQQWNVDRSRIAAYGGSAGAGMSLWLALHDDLADPASADPILRESTRLACAGSNQGQFSYDFLKWRDVFGADAVERFGGRYRLPENYGFHTDEEVKSAAGQKVRADCDMIGLITKDDPPIFLNSTLPNLALETTGQFLHHPKHSQLLYERLRATEVPVVASIPALSIAPADGAPTTWRAFAFEHLRVNPKRAAGAN